MTHHRLWAFGVMLGISIATPALSNPAALAPPHFKSEVPTARVDYWQKRAAEIDQQLTSKQSLSPVRLVFVGDSITDFWHLDANPWFSGKYCGQAIWNESFGGAVPAQTALIPDRLADTAIPTCPASTIQRPGQQQHAAVTIRWSMQSGRPLA